MRRLLLGLTAGALMVGCSGASVTSVGPPATAPNRSAVAAADALAMPGVTVTATSDGGQTLAAAMPCDQLVTLAAATDWRVTQLAPPPLDIYAMTLGDERALLRLAGSKSRCRALVTHAMTEPLKLSGADTTDRPDASFLPFACTDNNADDENEYELLGMYDAGDLHLLLDVGFNVAVPSGPATPGDGDFGVAMVAHGQTPMTDVLGSIMAAAAAGKRPDTRQLEIFQAGRAFQGTATVKKANSIDGSLQLSGLTAAGGKQIAITTGFHCSLS